MPSTIFTTTLKDRLIFVCGVQGEQQGQGSIRTRDLTGTVFTQLVTRWQQLSRTSLEICCCGIPLKDGSKAKCIVEDFFSSQATAHMSHHLVGVAVELALIFEQSGCLLWLIVTMHSYLANKKSISTSWIRWGESSKSISWLISWHWQLF